MWWKKNERVICFDLGGTNFRRAVIDFDFSRPKFLELEKKEKPAFSQIKADLILYAKRAEKKYQTRKIAISSAGIVDKENKQVFQAKQCYGKELFSFAFLEELGFEVFLENDGRCFAQGSSVFELKGTFNSVLSLVVGTGIGGGLLLNGKNYGGEHFSAMEVSHQLFNFNGKKEHWEDLAAGKGIEKQYSFLTGQKQSAEKIFVLARQGDAAARQVIKTAGDYFSQGLVNLINILDPEVLVLAGTLTQKQPDFFLQAIKTSQPLIFNRQIKFKLAGKTVGKKTKFLQVFFSRLNDRANLLGAGREAFRQE